MQRQNAEAERKAVRAQIIQLIKLNRVDRNRGEVAYQFSDGKKIKKIYVTAALQDQLIKGQLAVAKLGESYELVPTAVAEKLQQRDETVIVLLNTRAATAIDDDDPCSDFQIPDDVLGVQPFQRAVGHLHNPKPRSRWDFCFSLAPLR